MWKTLTNRNDLVFSAQIRTRSDVMRIQMKAEMVVCDNVCDRTSRQTGRSTHTCAGWRERCTSTMRMMVGGPVGGREGREIVMMRRVMVAEVGGGRERIGAAMRRNCREVRGVPLEERTRVMMTMRMRASGVGG